MKCIACGKDSTFPERGDGRCPGCHHMFAFEPRKGDRMSDAAFLHAIEAVSAGGKLRWTPDHLYYEICRRLRWKVAPPNAWMIVLGLLAALAVGIAIAAFAPEHRKGCAVPFFLAGAAGLVVGVAALVKQSKSRTVALDRPAFDALWKRWLEVHSTPNGLIVRRTAPKGTVRPEADLFDYSFDRAVICDRPATVDTLVANNFHFENNCAILGITGYPEPVFETVRQMLRGNPKLEVYALHDATPLGCRLAHRLAHDKGWFAGTSVSIVDVGLRPGQAPLFAGLLLPAESGVVPPDGAITDAEAAWLSQWRLELAAIRPEQVLKRLYRAVNRQVDSSDSTSDGGGGVVFTTDTSSFSSDADGSEGGADGFG